MDNQTVFAHPSCTLFNSDWALYHKLVLTTKKGKLIPTVYPSIRDLTKLSKERNKNESNHCITDMKRQTPEEPQKRLQNNCFTT